MKIKTFVWLAMIGWLVAVSGAFAASIQTVTFQDGVNGYSGTVDTWTGDGAAHGSEAYTYWGREGGGNAHDYYTSLRFDSAISALPANAFILNAYVTLTRSAGSQPGALTPGTENGGVIGSVRRISAPWTEASTAIGNTGNQYTMLRNVFGYGSTWPDAAARNIDITPFARAWYAGTFANNGIQFQESNNQVTDIAFHSREASTVAYRPKLTIQYIVPEANQQIVLFAGTSLVDDTWMGSDVPPHNGAQTTINHGTDTTLYIGRNEPGQSGWYGSGLVKFNNLQATLQSALGADWNNPGRWTLDGAYMGFMYNGGLVPLTTAYDAHPLTAAATWTENGATWATSDGVNAWPAAWVVNGAPPGANAGAAETIVKQTDNTSGTPYISGMSLWDVKNTVSGWIYSGQVNNGWVIPSYYGMAGNVSGPFSSEGADFLYGGPFLILDFIPEPSTALLLGVGAALLWLRRGRR